MNPLQALINGMLANDQLQRAETQLTLGKLIERLQQLPEGTTIRLSYPHSYRGYYNDLAFESGEPIPVGEALVMSQSAMGEVFQGYKGGDYQMGRNTPVWIAEYGCCGSKLLGINDDGSLELSTED